MGRKRNKKIKQEEERQLKSNIKRNLLIIFAVAAVSLGIDFGLKAYGSDLSQSWIGIEPRTLYFSFLLSFLITFVTFFTTVTLSVILESVAITIFGGLLITGIGVIPQDKLVYSEALWFVDVIGWKLSVSQLYIIVGMLGVVAILGNLIHQHRKEILTLIKEWIAAWRKGSSSKKTREKYKRIQESKTSKPARIRE